jgi:membrane protein implicated in regulation of membrane protease activity
MTKFLQYTKTVEKYHLRHDLSTYLKTRQFAYQTQIQKLENKLKLQQQQTTAHFKLRLTQFVPVAFIPALLYIVAAVLASRQNQILPVLPCPLLIILAFIYTFCIPLIVKRKTKKQKTQDDSQIIALKQQEADLTQNIIKLKQFLENNEDLTVLIQKQKYPNQKDQQNLIKLYNNYLQINKNYQTLDNQKN